VSAETRSHNGLSRDAAAIEADIIRQREELARTVDALSEKLDVKGRAEHKIADLKDAATTESGRPRPVLVLAAGAAIAGVVALVWWRARG
jgi:tRNA(Ile)-lysidine synthase TilS/MesJ